MSKEKCDYCDKELERCNGELYNYCLECLETIENRGYNHALKDVIEKIKKMIYYTHTSTREMIIKKIEGLMKK